MFAAASRSKRGRYCVAGERTAIKSLVIDAHIQKDFVAHEFDGA